MKRRPNTVAFWIGRLPHWEVEDGRYFVTIHLSGAIPVRGRDRLRSIAAELRGLKSQAADWIKLQRRIFAEMEDWLDRTPHVSHLQVPEVAAMVAESILHRQQRGDWKVFEFVVMPSHVHLFFELLLPGLKERLEDFKRWTGHEAAKLLKVHAEHFWQREWFDHWSRSDEEDERIVQYHRNNPVKAGLVDDYTEWPYGMWSRALWKAVPNGAHHQVPPGRRNLL